MTNNCTDIDDRPWSVAYASKGPDQRRHDRRGAWDGIGIRALTVELVEAT
jgi:hypothetical protein